MMFPLFVIAQIDTLIFTEKASHLFPSLPIKSSYTSLFDRTGQPFLYSANMESGLGIYNVSNPNLITPILNYGITNFNNLDVSTLYQRNNSLFVGIGDFQVNMNTTSGLAILNMSNPSSPIIKDIWDSTLFTHGISHLIVEGNYAYLSTMTNGIIILNIANENNIQFVSHLPLDLNFPSPSSNAHNARGLKIKNDTLFICFDRGGLRMIDVTNKSYPVEVYKYINSTLNSSAAAAYNDIVLKGNYAFVSVDYCGLEILDISTVPFTPIQWYNPWNCNATNWSGATLHTNELVLSNHDSLLFVSGGQSELFVFDVTNPLNTKKIGEYVKLSDSLATHGLDVYNHKVSLSFIHTPFHIPPFTPFFADPGGLKVLDYQVSLLPTKLKDIDQKKSDLKLYPNPNNGEFVIELKSIEEPLKILIFNSLGQIIVDQPILQNKTIVKLSNCSNGLYQIKLIGENVFHTFKFIKE